MKLCLNCNVMVDETAKFCPYCGKDEFDFQHMENSIPDENIYNTPQPSPEELKKIPILQRPQPAPVSNTPPFAANTPDNTEIPPQQIPQNQNNFAQMPPQQQIQTKAKSPLIFIIPALLAVVLVTVLVLVFGFHTCDSCGSTYFGSENEVNFFNQSFEVCDDCLENVYTMFDF